MSKINRCLAEGRERFRRFVSRSEDGELCAEMGPLLSAFCDGEASAEEVTQVREHLRACAQCRATMRAYRAAPAAAAALAPALPVGRSLLDRAHETLAGLIGRFAGGGATDSTLTQIATAGGTRGAGMAALAKLAAVCVGTVGGAAACVATGVVPAPLELAADQSSSPRIERQAPEQTVEEPASAGIEYEPAPPAAQPVEEEAAKPDHKQVESSAATVPATSGGAVEYTQPSPSQSATSSSSSSSASGSQGGSAAGEFGP